MKRRTFLAASGLAITTLSAGCTDLIPNDDRGNYEFSMYNGSREAHSFGVRLGRGAGTGWFYDETIELDATSGQEDIAVGDTPSHIFVTVDSGEEFEFAWPASHSDLGAAAVHAQIFYEPDQTQEMLVTAQ